MFDPSTSPSSARANINLSIREEEEDCVRIWLSRSQCRALFLGTRVQHISSLSFESSNRETLFTDIAKYFPPPMDLVSGSGVTRDARKRKVEVLLSGEEFEEADWLQSRKWISANRQFQFFFFLLWIDLVVLCHSKWLNRNLLGDVRRRVVAPTRKFGADSTKSADLSLIDLWGGGGEAGWYSSRCVGCLAISADIKFFRLCRDSTSH